MKEIGKIGFMLFFLLIFSNSSVLPQPVLKGNFRPGKKPPLNNKPVPYSYLREADVMWSKRIWRVIPLNEKINLPLKFPLHDQTDERTSLIDVIFDAAIEGKITAYHGEHGE